MGKRIFFTGGSGKAGRHAVPWLVEKGYEVHNIDLVPLGMRGQGQQRFLGPGGGAKSS